LHAGQAPRRKGRAAPSGRARRQAHRAHPAAGLLPGRSPRGSLQARSLPVLAGGVSARDMPRASLPPHEVADLSSAEEGVARIAWAAGQMPVLERIQKRFARERPLEGIRIAACLHVTAETGGLLLTLAAGGAKPA